MQLTTWPQYILLEMVVKGWSTIFSKHYILRFDRKKVRTGLRLILHRFWSKIVLHWRKCKTCEINSSNFSERKYIKVKNVQHCAIYGSRSRPYKLHYGNIFIRLSPVLQKLVYNIKMLFNFDPNVEDVFFKGTYRKCWGLHSTYFSI